MIGDRDGQICLAKQMGQQSVAHQVLGQWQGMVGDAVVHTNKSLAFVPQLASV